MQLMKKKGVLYKWSDEAKKTFQRIKEAIAKAPALVSPNFGKEFFLYTFASDVSYATILTQKNNEGHDVPISYRSSNLQGEKLNYPDMEKQGFVVFKAIKTFTPLSTKGREQKSSTKNLICIIRKSVADNQRNRHNTLTSALWADRVTPKVALGNSPYFLVYRQEAILPPNITLPSLQLFQASRGTPSALLQERIKQLMRLEELRDKAINKFRNHQMIIKIWFDHHVVGDEDFQIGELVLKWDKLSEPKGKHMKFQHLWLGLFQAVEKIGQGTYRLKTLQGETEKLPVSGQHLKRYFE
eukprot:PITA_25118